MDFVPYLNREFENGSLPQTPNNQPNAMDISLSRSTSKRMEDQYASIPMFTRALNQVKRSQSKDNMIESDSIHLQMVGNKGSTCEMSRDYYKDTLRGELISLGCKVAYVEHGMPEAASAVNQKSLPYATGATEVSKMDERLSRMKSSLTSSMTNEFYHDQWLLETKGTYGYGNDMWPEDSENDASSRSGSDSMSYVPKMEGRKPEQRCNLVVADLEVLKEKFETPSLNNPTEKYDLPGMDIFVSKTDPEKKLPAGGSLLTFEAMAKAISFSNMWVLFCRKHDIEPRNPKSYFSMKRDLYKNKIYSDFIRDHRRVNREYDEFKVLINGLPESIWRCSDAYNVVEDMKAVKLWKEVANDELMDNLKFSRTTCTGDGTHWLGTWIIHAPNHSWGNHSSIIHVMLKPPSNEPLIGTTSDSKIMDLTKVYICLPVLVYAFREK
ncbi:hypothetical protein KIW84_042536 [Lathyrus oleraceus]|uniref:Uncharacterized protein n=1 Tax=Pisum sativum TaxID=3888 RepID=A0A9D4XFK1_PEA|nr:hypothetical protein KIW84_042536 [Pisum sativum]